MVLQLFQRIEETSITQANVEAAEAAVGALVMTIQGSVVEEHAGAEDAAVKRKY